MNLSSNSCMPRRNLISVQDNDMIYRLIGINLVVLSYRTGLLTRLLYILLFSGGKKIITVI